MNENSFSGLNNFHDWFRQNKDDLVQNPMDRSMNGKMSSVLLSYFTNDSFSWSACLHLNKRKNYATQGFDHYLYNWKKNCTLDGQKNFVQKISKLFGILLPK